MLESLFYKVASLETYIFIKKKLQHRCFLFKYWSIYKNTCFEESLQTVGSNNEKLTYLDIKMEIKTYINFLTLSAPCILEFCIKMKITSNFYCRTSLFASKGYLKAFKAFIKPFVRHHKEM